MLFKKKKKIEELNLQIELYRGKVKSLESENKELKILLITQRSTSQNAVESLESENKKLKKQLAGDRICSNYCRVCKNGITDGHFGYSCVLECHCKDFKSTKETHWLSIPPSTPLLGS